MTGASGVAPELVRQLVREVLREVVPAPSERPPSPAEPVHPAAPAEPTEAVRMRNDDDLDAFVRHLLRLFDNPKHRADLRAGRLRFRLAATTAPGTVQPVHRVERGAVTEAVVKRAAREGARLVLGPGAVLTPLGRDRARADGVPIEKERAC